MKSCSRRRVSRTAAVLALGILAASAVLADTLTYTYDGAGRLVQVKHANGTITHYTLDAAGNRVSVVTTLDTTPPTVPSGLTGTASSSQRQVSLNWSASTDSDSGVGGYKIYRGGSQIGSSTTATYADNTVACNTSYSYTVSAYDNATPPNVSAQSTAWSVTTPKIAPAAPAGLTVTSKTSTQVALAWSAPSDICTSITGYRVYRAGSQIGTSSTTSFTDSTTSGTTTYTYTVAAYDSLGSVSAQSSPLSVTTPDTIPPSVPTGLAATAVSQTQINLTWAASTDTGGSGLAGYKVYRGGTLLGTTTTTSYSNSGLAGYTTYTYTVAAYDAAGNVSAQSSSASAKTPDQTAPSVPTGLAATATSQTQINLTWTASTDTGGSGLAGYHIYRGGTLVGSTTSTSYNDTGLAGYTTYTYTVAAYDAAGNVSAQSGSASAKTPDQTPPSTPTSLTATSVSATSVALSWNASTDTGGSGLLDYSIYRNGSLYASLIYPPTTTFTDTHVGGGTTYSYNVVATDNAQNTSAKSNTVTVTTPLGVPTVPGTPTPSGTTSSSTWTESWAASSGPVAYYVFAVNNGTTTATHTVTAPTTSYSMSAVSGITYTMSVKACNSANQCSGYSASAVMTYFKGTKY